MAIRTDLTFDTNSSPRVIQVDSPSTEITVQDLVDSVRDFEAKAENMWVDKLLDAAGKEALGGGNTVGITITLKNAQVAFEDRGGPSFTQCKITGGNILAVDDMEAELSPIKTTDYTQVIISQSTSPLDIPGLVDDVWDEAIAGHLGSGSTGEKLNSGGGAPTAGQVADAVWDEARGDHVAGGSFGEGVKAESLNTQAKADVNAEADQALTDYDPPTRTEATSDKDEVITEVNANETKIDTIDGNVDLIKTETDKIPSIITDITFLKDIEGGKWKIVGNQMIFYKSDNSTEVARFNLFDDAGNPNQIRIFERARV